MRSLFPKSIAIIFIRDWDKYGGRVLGELFLETGENVAGRDHITAKKRSRGHWKN
jgi:hypothetical protein